MNDFSVSPLTQSAILYLYSIRDQILIDPDYQRMSDIWSKEKKQLLIDSILNGFDIPKFYFHELVPAKKRGKSLLRYAIIDGKQRLDALWGFIDGRFALDADFQYLGDDSVEAGGLTYAELGHHYPQLKTRFDSTSLSVVAVRTDDVELIEDMFSRLNEAVPLNAPEKRNAFPGPVPKVIRELAEHRFFSDKLAFSDKRYKYRDLAAKLLLIADKDAVVDTKKTYLDAFVRDWAERTLADAKKLSKSAVVPLERMASVFMDQDPLLKSVGMVLLVYHFFRLAAKHEVEDGILRGHFEQFEQARLENRVLAESDITKATYDLLEFDKYIQTPNDAYATKLRLSILTKYLREQGGLEGLPRKDEYFDAEA